MEKMSRLLPLNTTFLPPSHGVLKSLLENPLKLPLQHEEAFGKEKDKEKKLDDDGAGTTVPQSAFLGPTLWDKTLPYDGDTFQLEYMDLEEFLSENGIPPSPPQHERNQHQPALPQASPATPSGIDLSSRASTSVHQAMVSQNCMHSPVRPGSTSRLSPERTCVEGLKENGGSRGLLLSRSTVGTFGNEGQILPSNRNTPSPIDPDSIQVPVGYEPDPADLALSSIPGQEMFDPRKRKFSEEELKPQPMIKKARKVFIPEDMKDDKYWARRRKNNMAAKRSRDARRLKENQIAIRASFLEKENSALRQEVADLRKELGKCKNVLAKYEAKHGPL
ncbi:HLF transcription factor, PAR bZIP family member b isoform X2 [Latimeria chalumnae]|uniref:HLF transcription factor, PAR bZIP family member n=1 Tax=Latimeria chalumnae TaxID=7897 RepID=H3AXU2_LATCH|nr:PREDICTED: hepatic leukemia factor isoform X1 [Latimeria chalumnae]|eukprot:XP_005999997.1 PREDICTED: hepatic leukemia factor isoform X1 [Latimeria chalumnae]